MPIGEREPNPFSYMPREESFMKLSEDEHLVLLEPTIANPEYIGADPPAPIRMRWRYFPRVEINNPPARRKKIYSSFLPTKPVN